MGGTGQGLGGQLLAAAACRCLRVASEVGGVILIIDANNERAAAWYAIMITSWRPEGQARKGQRADR